MSTTEIVALIVVCSSLSSLLTAVCALVLARRLLITGVEKRLERAGHELEERLRAALESAAKDLLPGLREEVGGGLTEAAEGLLPKLRSEVEAGVKDGADSALPLVRQQVGEGVREALLGRTGERLARRGSSVLGAGLDLLLGKDDENDR